MTEKRTIQLGDGGRFVGTIIQSLGYRPRRSIIVVALRDKVMLSAYHVEYGIGGRPHDVNAAPLVSSMHAEGSNGVVFIGFEDNEDESLEPVHSLIGAMEVAGAHVDDETTLITVRNGMVYWPLQHPTRPPEPVATDQPAIFKGMVPGDQIAPSRSAMLAQWQSLVEPEDVPIGDDPSDGQVAKGAAAWAKACLGYDLLPEEVVDAATAVNNPLFRTALVLRLAPDSIATALLTEQMREYASSIEVPGDEESRIRGMKYLATHLPDVPLASSALTAIGHYLWWVHAMEPALAVLERVERFRSPAAVTLLNLLRMNVSPERVQASVQAALRQQDEREEGS